MVLIEFMRDGIRHYSFNNENGEEMMVLGEKDMKGMHEQYMAYQKRSEDKTVEKPVEKKVENCARAVPARVRNINSHAAYYHAHDYGQRSDGKGWHEWTSSDMQKVMEDRPIYEIAKELRRTANAVSVMRHMVKHGRGTCSYKYVK